MQILRDLLDSVRDQERLVSNVLVGAHWTCVSTGKWGLASTLLDPPPHQEKQVRDAGNLAGKPAIQLANYVLSERRLEASIGLATLNSLIEWEEARCSQTNAFELLQQEGQGKNVAIIGHFPFVEKLETIAQNLWVLEKRPLPGDVPSEEAEKILPQCDVVGISATTFINHTIEEILRLCRPDAFKMLVGPSTPMASLLFDHGIDALAGCRVVDPKVVTSCVTQGATFKQIGGVKLWTMRK